MRITVWIRSGSFAVANPSVARTTQTTTSADRVIVVAGLARERDRSAMFQYTPTPGVMKPTSTAPVPGDTFTPSHQPALMVGYHVPVIRSGIPHTGALSWTPVVGQNSIPRLRDRRMARPVNADLVFSDFARAMHLRRAAAGKTTGCRRPRVSVSADRPRFPLMTVRTDAWDYAARRT